MKALFIACVALSLAGGVRGQDVSDLPHAAKQALDKMTATVVQAKKKAVADLTSIMNSESRAGKLKVALAVDAKIKELSEEIDVLENKPGAKSTDFLPGTWRAGNGVIFIFDKNKTFSAGAGNFKWSGTWRVDGGKLIVDSTLFADTYDLPPQRTAAGGKSLWSLKGKSHKGELARLDKQD